MKKRFVVIVLIIVFLFFIILIFEEHVRMVSAGSEIHDIGFTGQRHDDSTGLISFPYRTYDPNAGRFLQRDPVEYRDGVSLYEYVSGNALGATDELGLAGGPIRKLTGEAAKAVARANARHIKKLGGLIKNLDDARGPVKVTEVLKIRKYPLIIIPTKEYVSLITHSPLSVARASILNEKGDAFLNAAARAKARVIIENSKKYADEIKRLDDARRPVRASGALKKKIERSTVKTTKTIKIRREPIIIRPTKIQISIKPELRNMFKKEIIDPRRSVYFARTNELIIDTPQGPINLGVRLWVDEDNVLHVGGIGLMGEGYKTLPKNQQLREILKIKREFIEVAKETGFKGIYIGEYTHRDLGLSSGRQGRKSGVKSHLIMFD